VPRASRAPTGARVESAGDATPAAGFVQRPVGVDQTAAGPAARVPLRVARIAVVARGRAATVTDVAHPACRVSSAGVACMRGVAVEPRPRQDGMALASSQSRAPQAWLQQPVVAAAARSSAGLLADAWPGRGGAPAAAPCLAPRFEAESSAEQSVPSVTAVGEQQVLRRQVRAAALRLSLRQPVVLRLEELQARSRSGVLHRLQQEAVVRPRRRVAVPRRQPELQQALRPPRPVAAPAAAVQVAAVAAVRRRSPRHQPAPAV